MDYAQIVEAGFQKYWVEKNYAEANVLLLQALALKPDGVRAIGYLADSYRMQGDLDSALRYAKRAVELAPKSAAAHTTLGTVLCDLGQHKEAVGELERALSERPDAGLYEAVARSKFGLGDFKGAVKAANLALERRPDAQTALWVKERIATTNEGLSARTFTVSVREGILFDAQQFLKQGEEMLEQGRLPDAYFNLLFPLRLRQTTPKARALLRKLFEGKGFPKLLLPGTFFYFVLRPSPGLVNWLLGVLVFFLFRSQSGLLTIGLAVPAAGLVVAIASRWLLDGYIYVVEYKKPIGFFWTLFCFAGEFAPSIFAYGLARGDRLVTATGVAVFLLSVLVFVIRAPSGVRQFKQQYSGRSKSRSANRNEDSF